MFPETPNDSFSLFSVVADPEDLRHLPLVWLDLFYFKKLFCLYSRTIYSNLEPLSLNRPTTH